MRPFRPRYFLPTWNPCSFVSSPKIPTEIRLSRRTSDTFFLPDLPAMPVLLLVFADWPRQFGSIRPSGAFSFKHKRH